MTLEHVAVAFALSILSVIVWEIARKALQRKARDAAHTLSTHSPMVAPTDDRRVEARGVGKAKCRCRDCREAREDPVDAWLVSRDQTIGVDQIDARTRLKRHR